MATRRKRNAKPFHQGVMVFDTVTGKKLSTHNQLNTGAEAARKAAKKTGHIIEVRDMYGVYFTAKPPQENPKKVLPRGKWISAKIRVTKNGTIQAKIKR